MILYNICLLSFGSLSEPIHIEQNDPGGISQGPRHLPTRWLQHGRGDWKFWFGFLLILLGCPWYLVSGL